jgi:hypothetical protein
MTMTKGAPPLELPAPDYAACPRCGQHDETKADLLAAASAALHNLDDLYGSEGEGETVVQKQLRAAIRKAIAQESRPTEHWRPEHQ